MISVKQSGLQRRRVAKIGPAALGSNPSLFKRKRRADTLVRTFLPLLLLPFLPMLLLSSLVLTFMCSALASAQMKRSMQNNEQDAGRGTMQCPCDASVLLSAIYL